MREGRPELHRVEGDALPLRRGERPGAAQLLRAAREQHQERARVRGVAQYREADRLGRGVVEGPRGARQPLEAARLDVYRVAASST